jgi:HEAT repeat protein
MDYWNRQSNNYRELAYNPKPSPKNLDRIMEEIKKKPEKLTDFLNVLPDDEETADFVKRIYDAQQKSDDESSSDRNAAIQRWLTYHSKYFSDRLVQTAQNVRDTGEYVSNQDELLALAKVDWEKARPIVERLYNDPTNKVSQVLARWAFYKHALATDSFGDIDRYRDELKSVVEDKSATAGMRDLALDALVKEKDWNGRDDWYYSLLEDETLAELRVNGQLYTGLTTIIYYQPDDKYIEKMIELLKSSNVNVRSAAVRNLGLILNSNKSPDCRGSKIRVGRGNMRAREAVWFPSCAKSPFPKACRV